MSNSSPPLAIVGIGCLFPKANDVGAYWANLKNGVDCITDVPATHWNPADYFDADPKKPDHTYARRGGFLDPYPFPPGEYGIAPNDLEAIDSSQLLALVAARMALADAGIDVGTRNAERGSRQPTGTSNSDFPLPISRSRVSVILGVTGTLELVVPLGARLGHPHWRKAMREAGVPEAHIDDAVRRIGDAYVSWQEQSFPGLLGNVVAGRIANRLDLHGTNCVVDAACASSLSALHLASMELATGRADVVVTGGVDTFNDIFMYMCFSKTPALSPTGDSRPFAANADGTILGEGLGIVVLKRLSDAERDGDRIYAVVKGIGTSSDGKGNAIYAPSAEGQKRCLLEAYAQAGVTPDTIELVEAHGTGTKVGDATEIAALTEVFLGKEHERARKTVSLEPEAGASIGPWCALGSAKSQIGHTKAAAGAAGLIKAALALYHKVLPPTIKVEKPAEALAAKQTPLYVNTVKRPWLRRDHPRRAAVSAFGFGGSNFHCVLEEHRPEKPAIDWDGDVEIVALSADSREDLTMKLGALNCHDWGTLRSDAAASRNRFQTQHKHRVLFVATRDGDNAKVRASAAQALAQIGAESFVFTPDGAYLGCGEAMGKLGVLFPGQGSQYVGMLRDLACQFPLMLQTLVEANAVFAERPDLPPKQRLSDYIFPPPAVAPEDLANQERELRATHVAQPAIGAVSLGALRVLDAFGVRPEAAAGHSFGELTALCAGGCYDAASLHRLSRLRGQLMAEIREGDAGSMLAVHADANSVDALLRDEQLDLVVANRNSPQQFVLSGATREIERAAKALSRRQIRTTRLPVSAAFHSSLVAQAERPFREALEKIRFQAAQLPVFANSSACVYPEDPAQIRTLLAGQLARPVDFVSEITTMVRHGVRTFIETGPGNTLTRLVDAILRVQEPGHKADAFALDASAGKRSGIVDLAHALARVAARGHEVCIAAWNEKPPHPEPRIHSDKPALVVQIAGANYVKPRSPRPIATSSDVGGSVVPPTVQPAGGPHSAPFPHRTAMLPHANSAGEKQQISGIATWSHKKTTLTSPTSSRVDSVSEPQKSPASALTQVLAVAQEGIAAFHKLQEQTAQLHRQFLQSQEAAQAALARLIEQQQQVMMASLNGGALPSSALLPTPPALKMAAAPAPVLMQVSSPDPAKALDQVESILLAVVAEKTGYPAEMLNLDMGLDADLGIDSIKRVEILSALQERLPGAPAVKPEHLGTLNTLRQIAEFLAGDDFHLNTTSAAADVPTQTNFGLEKQVSAQTIQQVLLTVVAEKTGYPMEMLELQMGLDADLGIDSIKRVEILSALQERMPNAPMVKPEHLGTLTTLQQIVDFLANGATTAAAAFDEKGVHQQHSEWNGAGGPPEQGSAQTPAGVITRKVIRSASLPFDRNRPAAAVPYGAEFWLVAESDALAEQLARRLLSRSYVVRRFAWTDALPAPPVTLGGLILWAPDSSIGDEHLLQAFRWLRHCGPALRITARNAGSVFATIARLDGAFGTMQWPADVSPLHGGFAGLAKTAALEWPEVACKAIDVARAESEETVADILGDELWCRGPVEVGISAGRLTTLELVEETIPTIDRQFLKPSDVVVISGGARGVTAAAALALAETYRCRLILLGRSPAPDTEPDWLAPLTDEAEIKRALGARLNGGMSPKLLQQRYQELAVQREIRGNLERIRRTGAHARYISVDVRDLNAVAAALHEVRRELGPITGIVHGAGVIEDKRIEAKTDEQFDRVFGTKVDGLRSLLAAAADDPLKLIVLFSSSTGRFGRIGQVDYAVANEVLNKAARDQAARRPNCRVVALNWGPWQGGMVSPGLRKLFEQEGIGLIPMDAGAKHFIAELAAADREPEVIVGATSEFPPIASAASEKSAFALAFERPVSVADYPVLAAHVLNHKAVLPLALHLEWQAHAAMHGNPGLQFLGVDNVRVLNGVLLQVDEALTLQAHAGKAARRDRSFVVPVELRSQRGDGRSVVHASGEVLLGDPLAPPLSQFETAVGGSVLDVALIYRDMLFHGEALQGLTSVNAIDLRGFDMTARTAPPPAQWIRDPLRPQWVLDALLVDCALQALIVWSVVNQGERGLPVAIGRYRQYCKSFPVGECRIVGRITGSRGQLQSADIEFIADGRLLARMENVEFVHDAGISAAFERNRLPATIA